MAFTVKKTPNVVDDLFEIADFIALDNPSRAYSFIDELELFFETTLSENPEIGKRYKGTIRQYSYKGYTAYYELDVEAKIVKIRHIVNLEKPLHARGIVF